MNNPQFDDPSEMVLVERNYEIQNSAGATNQALTKCIRLRIPVRYERGGNDPRQQFKLSELPRLVPGGPGRKRCGTNKKTPLRVSILISIRPPIYKKGNQR